MNRIREFYELNPEREWDRLISRSPAELYTTMRVLDEYLGSTKCEILDIGAGPGRIAIELAKLGHHVTVVDLSASNISLAQEKASNAGIEFTQCLVADACDLRQLDCSYDAILSFGPMYHLLEQLDRDKACREIYRLLKPQGYAFVSFITKSSVIRDQFRNGPGALHLRKSQYRRFMIDGLIRQDSGSGFTDFFAVHPNDIAKIMRPAQLADVELIGIEGGMAHLQHLLKELSPPERETALQFNYEFVRDPAMLYASDHLLYVGRKG